MEKSLRGGPTAFSAHPETTGISTISQSMMGRVSPEWVENLSETDHVQLSRALDLTLKSGANSLSTRKIGRNLRPIWNRLERRI